MVNVRDILDRKGSGTFGIKESETIADALRALVKEKIGALLIFNDSGKLRGILSERDIVRECAKGAENLRKKKIKDVMTQNLIVATMDDDISYVMGIMTKNRVRHIPIVEKGKLLGLVSIGDVVKAQLQDVEYENKYLREYMFGASEADDSEGRA